MISTILRYGYPYFPHSNLAFATRFSVIRVPPTNVAKEVNSAVVVMPSVSCLCCASRQVSDLCAAVQGRDCLIQKFRNSSVMLEPEECRPKVTNLILLLISVVSDASQLFYTIYRTFSVRTKACHRNRATPESGDSRSKS